MSCVVVVVVVWRGEGGSGGAGRSTKAIASESFRFMPPLSVRAGASSFSARPTAPSSDWASSKPLKKDFGGIFNIHIELFKVTSNIKVKFTKTAYHNV